MGSMQSLAQSRNLVKGGRFILSSESGGWEAFLVVLCTREALKRNKRSLNQESAEATLPPSSLAHLTAAGSFHWDEIHPEF